MVALLAESEGFWSIAGCDVPAVAGCLSGSSLRRGRRKRPVAMQGRTRQSSGSPGNRAAMAGYWPLALGFMAAMTGRMAAVLVGGDN